MAFPSTRLPVTVEMAFGATGSPLGWTWTDVTARLESQSITIRRGRPDEGGTLQPTAVAIELQNNDGHLMPGNAASPYWPNVVRGTPLRISVDGAETALVLDGTGWASTPDHASFDVTDLDLRIRCQPDAWASEVTWTNGNRAFANIQYLISKWVIPGNQRSFAMSTAGAGWPSVAWSSDGTLAVGGNRWFSAAVGAQRPIWLGVTVDTNDGSGNTVTSLWRSTADAPPADITTWELLETATTVGSTSVFGGSAEVQVGAFGGAFPFRGRVYAAEIRSTINGTVVANPVFSSATPGATTVTDSTGKVWTLQGTAKISTRRPRFVGTVDEIVPTWPYGDHNASGSQPSEARVQITASDLVRRLGQGAKALRSSLYRHVTSSRYAGNITAYWPCEDDSGAVQLASGKTGVGTMALTGKISAGSDATLAASAPLPTVQANEAVRFVAGVPAGGPASKWAVEWVAKIDTLPADPASTQLMLVLSGGTARQWRITLNSTLMATDVTNNDGAVIAGASVSVPNLSGEWMLWRLDASETAGTITWILTGVTLSAGTGVSVDGAFSGTLGAVAGIDTSLTAPADGMSFGHVIVHDGNLPVGWLAGADTAWVGESAAHRIWRLCTEEGIPAEVVGESSGLSALRGEIARSEPMGPQSRATLLTLLSQAAGVDLGALGTRRAAPGFVYRTRKTLENQSVALALDAAADNITNPLEPRLDDQRLRNDVTVASSGGSSARAANASSVALEGLYAEQVTINGVGGVTIQSAILSSTVGLAPAVDSQNLQQAGWRLALGTWPGLRYPTLTIDLGTNPELIAAFHDLDVGDRVTLTGLPDQHPAGTVDLLVEGWTERLTPTTWLVTLTCSPGGPWQLGATTDLAVYGPTFGWWAVDRSGAIIRPNGQQFRSAGMNGGVGLALGQLGQTVASGRRGLWALDRYPAYRLETGSVHDTPATQWLPGGHINSGVYFDQGANSGAGDFVTIPSRVPWYRNRWNMHLYRLPCWLRPTTNITWEGISPDVADVIAGYVAECRKLVDEGLVVAPEHHGFSATDPTLPAALVATPSLSATDSAITGHTFAVVESTYMPTGADLSQSLQFYDALAAEFAGGDENIWIGLPNEAWTTGYSTAYRDWVTVYVRRLRAAGFQGIITYPLPRWSQDLAAYADGAIDALYDHLNTFGVAFNLVAEVHCYGRNWAGGSSTLYTYDALRAHLEACRNAGATGWPRPLWIAEVGEAYPAGTSATGDDAADRRGVELLLTDIHGPALAGEYPDTCCTGWSFADGVFDSSYAVSTGYLNKGNAELGPDPNTDGVTNPNNPFPGTYPWWDLDPTTTDGQAWLTRFGAGMADIADRIRPRDTGRLAATSSTLASIVTTTGTSLPLTADGWATSPADYPVTVEVNGEQMRVGGVTGTNPQTLAPVERALNIPAKTHAAGSVVQIVDKLRLSLGSYQQVAVSSASTPAPGPSLIMVAQEPKPTVAPTGSGITRTVTTLAEWNTAAAAAVAGDVIDITANITNAAGLDITSRNGTATNPIVITSSNGSTVTATPGDGSDPACIDALDCTHVHVIGVRCSGGNYSVRFRNVKGSAGSPVKIRNCVGTGAKHANFVVQANGSSVKSQWFEVTDNEASGNDGTAVQIAEGVYIGKGDGTYNDRTSDGLVARNYCHNKNAEAIECKPGTSNIVVRHNYGHDFDLIDDTAGTGVISLVVTPAGAIPADYTNANIDCYGNRYWNVDTRGHGVITFGFSGIDVYGNLLWSYGTNAGVRARGFGGASGGAVTAGQVYDNTMIGKGYDDGGTGTPSVSITTSGNIYNGTGTGQHVYNLTADFVGPTTGEAVATGYATGWNGAGTGYMLKTGSGAIGVGNGLDGSPMVQPGGTSTHYGAMPPK